MNKHVFVCEDNIENMLTAIFDAFSYRNRMSTDNIDIIISCNKSFEYEFFCDYEKVETSMDKAYKTAESIRVKLGKGIYDASIKVLCHFDERRVYILFKFLELCFRYGRDVSNNLTNEYVMKAMELSRKTQNESHLYLGITRFQETYGILYATIEPKCNAIPLITEHFADRYPKENWIIYDKTRNIMAVHKALGNVEILIGNMEEIVERTFGGDLEGLVEQDRYEELWKLFFKSIAIDERYNPTCQRTLLPLWMRKHMKEFEG